MTARGCTLADSRRGLPAKDTVGFVLGWLVRAARRRQWGELKIVVQDGQIVGVHEHASYRDALPALPESENLNVQVAIVR